MKKNYYFAALLFAAAVGITACGSSKSSMTAETTAAMASEAAYQETAYDEAYDSVSTKAESGSGISGPAGQTAALPAGRKLIRNVTMQVETDQFDQMISGINAKISELGGYVEQSDISGNSMNYRGEPLPRYANITARIPGNKLDSFVGAVSDSGNITNKSESTQDVTLQYSDVESRKKSLEIEQERIWQFLEKAESIDTVITLEQRLSDIRYQLESMESQLRLYDNQVDYSTVYLNISEVTAFTPTAPESTGTRIKNGLADNFQALTQALTNLLVFLITTSPFWIPLAVILAIVITAMRRHNRKISRLIEMEKEKLETKKEKAETKREKAETKREKVETKKEKVRQEEITIQEEIARWEEAKEPEEPEE